MRKAVLLLLVAVIIFSFAPYVQAYQAGVIAPDFMLPDLEGKKVRLSDFRGKAVLLNFWATWCGPCVKEMSDFNDLYVTLKNRGLVVIGVSVDLSEESVRYFVKKKKLLFPILHDKTKDVAGSKYRTYGLPTTFLIKPDGTITEKLIGERPWGSQKMKEKIYSILPKSK
ncbi:MAG: redoxin domain-containing protein [Nitrospiraceae bacterium]|nr:redoxin domain-containing protein [Nitrospiraceae bacterium]